MPERTVLAEPDSEEWQRIDQMARALAVAGVDSNEFAVVVRFVKDKPDVTRLFTLLDRLVREGYLVRSEQTRGYERAIREVCEQHLEDFRSGLGDATRLPVIMGWAVRLLRYYRSPAGQRELHYRPIRPNHELTTPTRTAPEPQRGSGGNFAKRAAPSGTPPTRKEAGFRVPSAPVRTETRKEKTVVVTVGKAGKGTVRTEDGHVITCTGLPSFNPLVPGDEIRADVTRESGKPMRSVFKGR